MTAQIIYRGDLRCECTHLQSCTKIETDAPTDNRGKGERFSPTDTVCVALATCMITTMAIRSSDMNIDISGATADVSKHMAANPRRISQIDVTINLPALQLEEKDRSYLQHIGDNCPVVKSLNPEIKLNVVYNWS